MGHQYPKPLSGRGVIPFNIYYIYDNLIASHSKRLAAVMLACLLVCLSFTTDSATADGHTPPRRSATVIKPYWEYEVGSPIQAMATADLDSDGQKEILVGTETGSLLVLQADGVLLWDYKTAASTAIAQIIVADFLPDNQANRPEVLVRDSVSRLLMLRGGTQLVKDADRMYWQWPSVESPSGGEDLSLLSLEQVAIANLNGDPFPEILIAADATDEAYLYILDGRGNQVQKVTTGDSISHMRVADLSGDGAAELLLSTVRADDSTRIMAYAADWPEISPMWTTDLPGRVGSLAAANVQGDEGLEVLAGSEVSDDSKGSDGSNENHAYYVLAGTTGLEIAQFQVDQGITTIMAHDLNADGEPEVVIGSSGKVSVRNFAGQEIWEYEAQSSRTQVSLIDLGPRPPALLVQDDQGVSILRWDQSFIEEMRFFGGGSQEGAVFSDVNGDGFSEVVIAAGQQVRLFGYNRQDLERKLRWTFPVGASITTVDFGDVDGDGLPEIVAGASDGNVYILREGERATPGLITADAVNIVRLADLDGDGAHEILAGSADYGVYARSLDQDPLWQHWTGGEVKSLVVVDVAGHGPIVLAGSSDAHIYALTAGDGEQIWQAATGGPISTLATIELDDDGQSVILAGSEDFNLYALAANDGQERWRLPVGRPISTLTTADLDADGRPEVLVGEGYLGMEEPDESRDFNLYALAANDGQERWRFPIGRPISALTTADLDADGLPEVLVGAEDATIYLLNGQPDQTKRVIWKFEVNDMINTINTADVDGDGRLEVLAGTRDGSVYVLPSNLQAANQPESVYRPGGAVAHVGSTDRDQDGLAEIIAASTDGNIYLFGLLPNQTPLLLNPTYELAGAGWIYSIDVIDPEGDEVSIWLEIQDPARLNGNGLFEQAEIYTGGGEPQTLSWFDDPFDWWDSGLETQFRFTDRQPEGIRIQAKGPRLSGWRWWVSTIVTIVPLIALVGGGIYLTIKNRQHWRASPQGQAGQIYHYVVRNPHSLLMEIREVIGAGNEVARTLSELQLLFERAEDNSARTNVIEGYALMARNPERIESWLPTLLSGLQGLAGVSTQEETLAVFKVTQAGLEANSISRIAALRSHIQATQAVIERAPPQELPGLERTFEIGLEIVQNLENYQKVQTAEAQLRYLGRAIERLSRMDMNAKSVFQEPGRSLLGEIVRRWLAVINNTLNELKGQAKLKVALKTQQVLDIEDTKLVLTLQNEGNAGAEKVEIKLLPSEQYQILDGVKRLPSLHPGRTGSAEFRLRPHIEERFRAEFEIKYDDELRQGHILPFANQINLVKADQPYQFIKNPYRAGRPLEKGNPLFFGREDVREFILQNINDYAEDNVLLLIGQRRTGKTSLLKQLPLWLSKAYVPVYIDLQQLGIDPGMANFFMDLSRIIRRSLCEQGIEVASPTRTDFEQAPSATFGEIFLTQVQAALGERRLVLAFDEFEELETRVRDGKLDPDIFPFMRHLMQHRDQLIFIFVGTHKLGELSSDYWSIFFNIALHRDIRFLDETAARNLITEPVKEAMSYDGLAVEELLDVTACHPYFLQLMCRALVNLHNNTQKVYITLEEVHQVVDEAIAEGEAHFVFIWNRASKIERLALAALTHLLAEEPIITSSDVVNKLAQYGQSEDPATISSTLRNLAAQDIIQESRDHTPYYEFKLDLIRRWIKRSKSLSSVVEEISGGI